MHGLNFDFGIIMNSISQLESQPRQSSDEMDKVIYVGVSR